MDWLATTGSEITQFGRPWDVPEMGEHYRTLLAALAG